MDKWIKNISGKIPHTNKVVNIDLDGKNLIVTGANGSGKTSFLNVPFFTESFPKIQFIVTTHSPFVLMSTPDTIVFDLAKNEPITEDLSYYTYSAVMKGLWNVKPISVNLENTIKEIAQIVNSGKKDLSRLRELTNKVKGREDALDNESKAFYLLGLETLEEGDSYV
jgi:predicted ATP-binding protein involved in virulence